MRYIAALLLFFACSFVLAEEANETARLTVFFTNDIHGGIVPQKAEFLNPDFPPILGGGPSAATIINRVRRRAPHGNKATLLIDGGDTFQGTLVGTRSKGQAVVEYMNRMEYDAVVPGNHDFDLGKDNLVKMIEASTFPWVAANIFDAETGTHWEPVKPWVITEKLGMKVGITGATTMGTAAMSFPDNIRGLEFRDEISSLQATVSTLRDKGCDLVVVLLHIGLPYDPQAGYEDLLRQTPESVREKGYTNAMEIAHFVRGIDLMVGGHLHKGYREVWEDPVNHTICMQNYGNLGNLGWLDIDIDLPTRSIAGYEYAADKNSLLLLQQDQFWPDSTMQKFIDEQRAIHEEGFRDIIGETRTALTRSSVGEAPLNNLICDVLCEAGEADFSFMNFGGIRADVKSGSITREDIFKVLPFGNEIVTFEATGAFLKRIVERKLAGSSRGFAIGGARVTFNKTRDEGKRAVEILIGGKPIDPAGRYKVATTDYLIEGNSGLVLLKRVPKARVAFRGQLLREAVIGHIQANSPLEIKLDGRWQRDDAAQPSAEWKAGFEK